MFLSAAWWTVEAAGIGKKALHLPPSRALKQGRIFSPSQGAILILFCWNGVLEEEEEVGDTNFMKYARSRCPLPTT